MRRDVKAAIMGSNRRRGLRALASVFSGSDTSRRSSPGAEGGRMPSGRLLALPAAALVVVLTMLVALAGLASAAASPVLVSGNASNLGKTTATLPGTVTPNGEEIESCYFRYGTDSSLTQTAPCAETPAEIGPGNSPVSVHADLSGLEPGTEYSFMLAAHNSEGSEYNSFPPKTFITLGPVIGKEAADTVRDTSANVSAFINPNGQPTTFHFEYVDDAGFQAHGFSGAVKLPVPDGPVGAGAVGQTVSTALSGLQPATLYHFRAVATNTDGTINGADATFSTYPSTGAFPTCGNDPLRYGFGGLLPDCRAYEQATEVEKDGTNPQAVWFGVKTNPSGSAITFYTPGGMPGGSGSGAFPSFVATRGHESWKTTGLLPPAALGQSTLVLGSTEDLSARIDVASLFGSGEGLFLVDNATDAVQTIVPHTQSNNMGFSYVGASADNSTIFFEAFGAQLTPDAAGNNKENLYAWSRGTGAISLVGTLPESECGPSPCAPANGSFAGSYSLPRARTDSADIAPGESFNADEHVFSVDGSKAYFTSADTGQIYLRKNPTSAGASTVQVSASQKTNGDGPGGVDASGPKPAPFLYATPDGSQAFFMSAEELTDDANTGPAPAIGRANLDGSGASQSFLPTIAKGVAVDGSHIYWADPGRNSIGRANLDGSGVEAEFIAGADNPRGVAVGLGHIYWTNAAKGEDGEGTIGRANLDGSGVEESFVTGASEPESIAVDSEHIYWCNMSRSAGGTGRANLDGSAVEQSFLFLSGPGLAVDAGHIYLGLEGAVLRFALDGSEREFLLGLGANRSVNGVAVDSGHIYVTNATGPEAGEGEISRASLDGSGLEMEFIGGVDNPEGIAVDGAHIYWGSNSGDAGSDLYRFEAGSGQLTDLTPDSGAPSGADVQGMLGASEDGSYLYFVANGDLDGPGPAVPGDCSVNPATHVGECNLYLWHNGQITFVARLDSSGDSDSGGDSDAADWPASGEQSSTVLKTSRISANGQVAVFRSKAKLTGYDNRGVYEYYRYDASTGKLQCVTCNPSGAAPEGRPILQPKTSFFGISIAPNMTHNLSRSGDRFFFQSPDALLPADTNSVADVYEWEADGSGSCEGATEDGGCLYLLSTGKSPSPSYIGDASPSGDDVYLYTEDQLVAQDEDELVDIYDARVDGGMASQNPQRPPACSGEGCRGTATQAPGANTAGSAVFTGPGNSAARVGCVADPTIKRLNKSVKSLRRQAQALSRRADRSRDPRQARQLEVRAHHLAKSARAHEKRANGLVKRCRGVGRKGSR